MVSRYDAVELPAAVEAGSGCYGRSGCLSGDIGVGNRAGSQGKIRGSAPYVGIAGYSLAGLFALYAMYRCDCFARVASISGSLWFPKFREYVLRHELMRQPEMLYMSLGDAEAKTKHAVLKTVQENTEAIVRRYQEVGVDVRWELNPGNHFRDVAMRSAKGIKAILEA